MLARRSFLALVVGAGVPVAVAADVDKAGIRIGVIEKAGADALLSQTIKSPTLVRAKSVADLYSLVDTGKADVIAATKTGLFDAAKARPGSRVLEGRILVEPIGMAVPKGSSPGAAAYVARFVDDAKTDGLVKAAIARAALQGVAVAPPR